MKPIPVGAKSSHAIAVEPQHLASGLKDASLPPVLATPVVVTVMENAALDAIKAYLDRDETALGTNIDIRHLSPTPVGMRVVAEAEVTEVEGRRVTFSVTASDESGQIAAGTHERMVVKRARIEERIVAKAARTHLPGTTRDR